MNYKEIYKNNIQGAYLFYGYEKLIMDNTIDYVIKKYVSLDFKGFNLNVYESKDLRLDTLMSSCETLPVFSDKRVIIIKNVNNFSQNIDKEFFKFLDELSDFVIIIFVDGDDKLNKTKSFYKYFSKRNRNIEFPKLNKVEIKKFVSGYLMRKGYEISPLDLSYFVDKSSYESKNIDMTLYDLKNEIDKMLSYLGDKKIINRDIIDISLSENSDSNIFSLLDAMSKKNGEKALRQLRILHLLNESNMKIMFMIIRQVRNLITYLDLKKHGYSNGNIMSQMGVKQFEFSKIIKFSNNFDLEFLYKYYEKLLEADELLKTTSIDDDILMEMLIVEFTI